MVNILAKGGIRLVAIALAKVTVGTLWFLLGGMPGFAQASANVEIDYTGALFGYFRNDGPLPGKKLQAVSNFFNTRGNRRTMLVGMGDNFAPEFGAALQYDCVDNKSVRIPERFYKAEHCVAQSPEADNVLNFLLQAGYRALVPGREDFIYSAAWLQSIARQLRARDQQGGNQKQSLVLLAANLRLDGKNCRLLFADDSPTTCVDSSGDKVPVKQDWVTRLDLTLADTRVAEAIAEGTTASPNKRIQMMVNEMKQLREVAPSYREDLNYFTDTVAYKLTGTDLRLADPAKLTEKLKDMANGDCESSQKQKDFCLLARTLITRLAELPAKQPRFLDHDVRAASERLMLRSIADEERDVGYTWDERPDTEGRTLIVGVIGDTVMDGVSPTYLKVGNAKVIVLDPVATVVLLIRAAALVASEEMHPIKRTIILAQMPRGDAEELATRVRIKLQEIARKLPQTTDVNALRVDLVLSEAQPDRATTDVQLEYDVAEVTPVITPRRAFNIRTETVDDPISTITITQGSLRPNRITISSKPKWELERGQTTALDLMIEQFNVPKSSQYDPRIAAVESMFERFGRYERADIVLLPRRDLYFGRLPEEYAKYEACDGLGKADERECKRRVALDRVFWKGDSVERVMISGQDLKKVLKTSQQKAQSERNLAPSDIIGQWLYTFGIVTNEPDQLTRIEMSSDRFSLPQNDACKGDASAAVKEAPYCINGSAISDDGSYWIVTTDSLAHDTKDYSLFSNLLAGYHQPAGVFLTHELQDALEHEGTIDLQDNPTVLSISQQYEGLFHLDIAKWVAGFSIRHPAGGNAAAAKFQGVADSRASQTTQQELDLESTGRVYRDIRSRFPFSIGNQTILEYDRSVQGNLSQKPITANYALNNFSTNLFLQKRIPYFWDAATIHGNWANRELPRTLMVLTPLQYQEQVVGSRLYFSHSAGNGQLTVSLPRAYGYSSRIGFRHEIGGGSWWKADRASYFEAGFQLASQYNILESITLSTGSASATCAATGTETIPQCFGNNKQFTIDATTTPTAIALRLLHATGWYWDVHLQKGVWKNSGQYGINLSLDSKGDMFQPRHGAESLSNQTRYAFPITTAINFPVLRNLTLSPTYSPFFYKNQVAGEAITVNTFSITAKWFYDRDSRVPLLKQLVFKGPASLDQTKSAKMK